VELTARRHHHCNISFHRKLKTFLFCRSYDIYLAPLVRYTASNISGYDLDLLRSCDVMVHVTIGLGICGFLLVVLCNHASILHRYGDMEHRRFWGHRLDLLGSRDVDTCLLDNLLLSYHFIFGFLFLRHMDSASHGVAVYAPAYKN